jgi:ABC-type glycerol-3-phosphate transport system substrate-binding protein
MTSVKRFSTGLALGLAALALAGCGSSPAEMSTADAEKQLWVMLEDKAPAGTVVTEVTCLDEDTDRWQCVAAAEQGDDEMSVSGTFSCDDKNCLWRPD